MDLWILSEDFTPLGIVDTFSSAIWANRYRQCGDFEIYAPASIELLTLLRADCFVVRRDDDMVGIIEKIKIDTDEENGDYITVSGRCTRSILARRIVWDQTALNDTAENIMRQLVTDAFISPTIAARKYDKLALGTVHGWTGRVRAQYTGDNILEAYEAMCTSKNYGFNVPLKDNMLVVELYKPTDRSVNQDENPHVVFSEQYDNLIATTYTMDKTEAKNVALVAGEGEGSARRRATCNLTPTPTGLHRREIYVDARDVSSNEGEIAEITYTLMLSERGEEALGEKPVIQSFEGTVEPLQMYTYKQDYFLGDIVTVCNKYGIQSDAQVVEVVEVWDESGYRCTPTFG